MDNTKPDFSSGIHKYTPMHNVNSTTSLGHAHGAIRMPSVIRTCGSEENIRNQIHCMEIEAYGSVLRAFIAQSDLLSWGKEGLITELRRELNVTDVEHGDLLAKINSDKSVKMIRERRKGTYIPEYSEMDQSETPCFAEGISHKKLKGSHPAISNACKYVTNSSPPPAHIPPYPAQFNDEHHTHELAKFSSGSAGRSMKIVMHSIQAPYLNRGKGSARPESKNKCHISGVSDFKKRPDIIKIRATDKLMHEVEGAIFCTENPDPSQLLKAKLILREHENDILEALDKLAAISEADGSPNQVQHHDPHKELDVVTHNSLYRQENWSSGYFTKCFVHSHPAGWAS